MSSDAPSNPLRLFLDTRSVTEKLCAPLLVEDCALQAMPDASPTKWHLAHTSWFFEQFVLAPHLDRYAPFDKDFAFFFNSYYERLGRRIDRSQRGWISRPTLETVYLYRKRVTEAVATLCEDLSLERGRKIFPLVILGIHHEQQHQELILTDIKYNLYFSPARAHYREASFDLKSNPEKSWIHHQAGLREIGFAKEGFSFDNERPRHQVFLEGFSIQKDRVTNSEFLEFILDGGYQNPLHWLSDGWAAAQKNDWKMPLYWEKSSLDDFSIFTLNGTKKLRGEDPVCHVSYYEADAYARWKGFRLPTEAEWELAASEIPLQGEFLESGTLHPHLTHGFWGSIWNWTASPYVPYPGFKPPADALGEYNAKFMSGQMVLRGGSCATPRSHIRPTYRNFFHPESRWQFTGMRLAL